MMEGEESVIESDSLDNIFFRRSLTSFFTFHFTQSVYASVFTSFFLSFFLTPTLLSISHHLSSV